RPDAELRLGKAHWHDRKRKIRRRHRGVGKPDRGPLHHGAREIRDERWRRHAKRAEPLRTQLAATAPNRGRSEIDLLGLRDRKQTLVEVIGIVFGAYGLQ